MRLPKSILVAILAFSYTLLIPAFSYADSGEIAREPNGLLLATTTTTTNSGLLSYLLPTFEKDTGINLKVFSVGSGAAIRLGTEGLVDVVMVHAPMAEDKFIQQGFGVKRHPIMHNDFVLVGPKSDPAKIKGVSDITIALNAIAKHQALFVSRADDSGTNKKELSLWKRTRIDPYGEDWYLETGTGMAATLWKADEKQGYTLTDRGTWLARGESIKQLEIVSQGDERLHNYYSVIMVNPEKHKQVNVKAAQKFIKWMISPKGQDLISNYKVNNQVLFYPNAIK